MHFRFLAICFVAFVVGCGGPRVEKREVDPTMQRIIAVGQAYGQALAKGKAPGKPADLDAFLKTQGDPAELIVSPRDGQPFVILWGTRFTEVEPKIYIHEKEGKDGTRFVLMTDGASYQLPEERFQRTPKVQ